MQVGKGADVSAAQNIVQNLKNQALESCNDNEYWLLWAILNWKWSSLVFLELIYVIGCFSATANYSFDFDLHSCK